MMMLYREFPIDEAVWEAKKVESSVDKATKIKEDLSKYSIPNNATPHIAKFKNELSSMAEMYRTKYNQLQNFIYVTEFSSYETHTKIFVKYLLDNPNKAKDVIMPEEIFTHANDEYLKYPSFTILDEDFGFVYSSFKGDCSTAFLFYSDPLKVYAKLYGSNYAKYEPSIYELRQNNQGYFIIKAEIDNVEEPILNKNLNEKIHSDMDCFFNNKKFYIDNNLAYKRGVMLYGAAGCGKTSLIKKILLERKDSYRLLVDTGRYFGNEIYEYLQEIFPKEAKKIIVFEDVESINDSGEGRTYGRRSSFLNFIDGAKIMDNTMFIATTNYPDLVDPALINRPSRFDKIYKIDYPTDDSRHKFLLKFFPDLIGDLPRLAQLVKLTKDFSGAYFKELFITVGIQNTTIENAIEVLTKQMKMCKDKKFDSSKRGMGIGNSYDED